MSANKMMQPSEIRFTQDSIGGRFMDGRYLSDTFEELLNERLNVADIPCIEVAYRNGAWWAITGNRRLYLYRRLQQLGVLTQIPVKQCGASNRVERMFENRLTTECDGKDIDVRQVGALRKIESVEKTWRNRRPNSRQAPASKKPVTTQPSNAYSNITRQATNYNRAPINYEIEDEDDSPTFAYTNIQVRPTSNRSTSSANNFNANASQPGASRASSYIRPAGNYASDIVARTSISNSPASVHRNGSVSRSANAPLRVASDSGNSVVTAQPSVWATSRSTPSSTSRNVQLNNVHSDESSCCC